MNIYDIILIAILIVCILASIYFSRRKRKNGGCCGCCSECSGCKAHSELCSAERKNQK